MRVSLSLFLSIIGLVSADRAGAHEFWISPEKYQVEAGEEIVAANRVGQNMKGASYSYIDRNVERFEIVMDGETIEVDSRVGDRPALSQTVPGEGLAIIVHETTDSILRYTEAEKFASFVEHKDLDDTLARHAERGLPEDGFRESYRRYGKSLVAVGSGAGSDMEVGLETEIIAEANPYTDDVSAGFPVRVLYRGQPRIDEQVELFAKRPDEDEGEVKQYRTDDQGRVVLPVEPGVEYLVDAVKMIELPNDDAKAGPVWKSLWASLTFRIPE